eukprot:6456410-Amphidinium_carterae.1
MGQIKKRSGDDDLQETPAKKAKASDVAAPVEPLPLERAWSAKSLVGSSPDSVKGQQHTGSEAASSHACAEMAELDASLAALEAEEVAKTEINEMAVYDESNLEPPPAPCESSSLKWLWATSCSLLWLLCAILLCELESPSLGGADTWESSSTAIGVEHSVAG